MQIFCPWVVFLFFLEMSLTPPNTMYTHIMDISLFCTPWFSHHILDLLDSWRGWGSCLTRQEVLNEAVILHFPYTKISDLSVGGEQCGCHYKPKDAEACFMNAFDHHVRFSRRILLGNHSQVPHASPLVAHTLEESVAIISKSNHVYAVVHLRSLSMDIKSSCPGSCHPTQRHLNE